MRAFRSFFSSGAHWPEWPWFLWLCVPVKDARTFTNLQVVGDQLMWLHRPHFHIKRWECVVFSVLCSVWWVEDPSLWGESWAPSWSMGPVLMSESAHRPENVASKHNKDSVSLGVCLPVCSSLPTTSTSIHDFKMPIGVVKHACQIKQNLNK